MRKNMFRLAWALLILAGGIMGAFTPKTADALTCRQELELCGAACNPEDWYCFSDCQCQFLMCKGQQCN